MDYKALRRGGEEKKGRDWEGKGEGGEGGEGE